MSDVHVEIKGASKTAGQYIFGLLNVGVGRDFEKISDSKENKQIDQIKIHP